MNNKTKLRPVKKIPKEIPMPEEKIPIWSTVLLGICAISAILLGVARKNPNFAEFFNQNISAALRAFLAFVTNPIPFSLAEFFILLLPLLLVIVTVYAIRHKTKSWRSVCSYAVSLIAAASVIFSSFVWVYGMGYHTPRLEQRLQLENEEVSAKELADTAKKIIDDLEDLLWLISYREDGASLMPYTLSEMNQKLMEAYEETAKKYDFISSHKSKVKPVLLSVPMSYAHFTGFYTFFTGEANINVHFPDYTIPFTAAHELAHGRGIARENEANFMAFLVCMESKDNYIRYCGLLNMYEYIMSALYSADTEDGKPLYREVAALPDKRIQGELRAYAEFFEKYRDSAVSEISGTINDSFLKANGTVEGEKSYGLVVNLAVSYYKKR